MPKFIAIFILIALNILLINATLFNNSSMNDTLLNNSSINNTLLSSSGLNNTLLNNSTSDDDWFNRSSNLSFALPPNLLPDNTRTIEEEQADVKFPTEKPIVETPIWSLFNPPAIEVPDPVMDDPVFIDDPSGGGCSEPVCTEDGICYSLCVD